MIPFWKTHFSWQRIVLMIVAILIFIGIIYLSMLYFLDFNNSMLDLGNISQAVWNITKGNSLVYTAYKGQNNRLNGHAEIILYIFSPIYFLFPHPVTLISLQGLLFICGAIPVFKLAKRKLKNENYATILALTYLLFPVGLTGVFFDIHGDTLALPLLLFMIDAADREATFEYIIFCVLSLSCKSYAVIPVFLFAVLLWFENNKELAKKTIILILLWELSLLVVRFLVIDQGSTNPIPGISNRSIGHYFEASLVNISQTADERLLNGLIAVFPALLLGIWSIRKMLPGLLILVPVLLSSGPGPVYRYTTHHYGFIVPFLFSGMVFGANHLKNSPNKNDPKNSRWKAYTILSFITALAFCIVFLPLPGTVVSLLNSDVKENVTVDKRDELTDKWLKEYVPENEPILSDTFLASHLTNREVLYRTTYLDSKPPLTDDDIEKILPKVDYIVVDIFSRYGNYDLNLKKHILSNPGFNLVEARDGLLIFSKSGEKLHQSIYRLNGSLIELEEDFGNGIGLVESNIEKIENNKYSIKIIWTIVNENLYKEDLIAISRIAGIEHSRIVHLPSFLIYPFNEWEVDMLIYEEIEFNLPEENPPLDRYDIYLGLYERAQLLSGKNATSLGNEIVIGTIETSKD